MKGKKAFGIIVMVLCACVAGFLLYRFVPNATVWAEEKLQNAGPLIILAMIVLAGISFIASLPMRFLAEKFKLQKRKMLGAVCGLCLGLPVTIALISNASNGLYSGGFTGFAYVLLGGIGAIVLTFLNIGMPGVLSS